MNRGKPISTTGLCSVVLSTTATMTWTLSGRFLLAEACSDAIDVNRKKGRIYLPTRRMGLSNEKALKPHVEHGGMDNIVISQLVLCPCASGAGILQTACAGGDAVEHTRISRSNIFKGSVYVFAIDIHEIRRVWSPGSRVDAGPEARDQGKATRVWRKGLRYTGVAESDTLLADWR
ncbi:hypothetical protein PHISCL_06219 [Aspergillus sclerotialis]|uniref:Uncharacterized protein n=1 Tax=Aspergillus sclerotialis TaxID=2070753 RepID=A0A3A2ZE59_9EURO|nr:hypothetical protein PHISCL_06219 [Aspergillus sclerotialis]